MYTVAGYKEHSQEHLKFKTVTVFFFHFSNDSFPDSLLGQLSIEYARVVYRYVYVFVLQTKPNSTFYFYLSNWF